MNDQKEMSRSSCRKKRLDLDHLPNMESEDTQQYLFSPYYTSVLDVVNNLATTSLLSRNTLKKVHLVMKKGEKLCR